MQAHGSRAWVVRVAAVGLAVGMAGAGAAPPGVNLLPQAEFRETIERLPGADSPAGRLHEAETVRYTDTRTSDDGGGSVSATAANLSTVLGAPLLAVQGMASFSGTKLPGESVTATVEVNYWFEVIADVPDVPIQLPLAWTVDGTRTGAGAVMVQWEASLTPQINRFRGLDTDGRFFSANTFNGLSGFQDDDATMLTVVAGTADHEYYQVHLRLTGSAGRGADPFRQGGGGAFNATLDPLPRVDPSFAGAANVRFVFSDNLLAAPVPEPGTWALWLAGLLALGTVAARQRRRGGVLAMGAPAVRPGVVALAAWAGLMALAPAPAVAAFAQADVQGVETPVTSAMDGFGGTAPQAHVLLSGGGPLRPSGDGQGSFIVAASAGNARGDLHASVDVATVGRGRASGFASASVLDTLVIGGTRPVELELRLEVQGSFFGNGQSANFSATAGLTAGALSGQGTLDWFYSNGAPNPQLQVRLTHTSGDVVGISREPGNAVVWITTRQTVDPGTTVPVSAFLQVSATANENSTALAEFGHTAQLWLGLPAGTPFTSRSGVFLTEAPSLPVPEPAGWLLMLAGLGSLFAWPGGRHQRGRRASTCATLAAGLLLGLIGGAQAITTASASSNTFQSGLFNQLDMTALPRAAVALSGAGLLNTGPGEGSFLATGESDLRRGTLRASAETSTTGRGVTLADASATFGDVLFFDNTNTITVTLQLAVHGAFDGLGPVAGEVNAGLNLGGERLEARLRWNTDAAGLPTQAVRLLPVEGGTSAARQVELRSGLAANTLALVSLTRDIEPGWMLSVGAWMGLSARAGTNAIASASFGNTAQASLLVPDGVTVRSVSGHFLAEPLAPVPEPATWAMLAAGLLVVLPVLRAHRRLTAAGAAAAALLVAAAPASAQLANAAVWNSSNFSNPNPAANLRSQEVTSGRAEVGHSATTNPFSDRVEWVAGATADLRRGGVGVEIQADRIGNPAATQGDTVWAHAELNETLTFTGSRAGVVDFAAGISGSFQGIDGSAFRADGFLFAGGLSGQLDFRWVNNLSSPTVSVFASPGTTGIRSDPAGLFGTIHLLRLVQPGETLALLLRLDLRVGPGAHDHAVANFGHTAKMGIRLPEGMAFSSASGHFMADAPPLPVPEPAGAWMLLAGLPLLACWRRCR